MLRVLKKFNVFLDKKQKGRLIIVVILMIIAALFETVGVSLIVPIVTAMTNPNFINENKYAAMVCDWFGLDNTNEFLIFMLGAFGALYIIKAAYLFFEYWVQQHFLRNNQVRLQKRLMEIFLRRPYEYYLNISSGDVIQLIINDVSRSYILLQQMMNFFSEGFVSLALAMVVFIINPVMAGCVALVLVLELFIIAKFLRKKLTWMGIETRRVNSRVNKWLLQAIEGIKVTKISRKEGFFHSQYSKHATKNARITAKYNVYNNTPRLLIENVTVSAMMVIMIVMMIKGTSISELLPVISAFAVAAVRLLPSANRISSVFNGIPYYEPNLDAVIKNMEVVNEARNGVARDFKEDENAKPMEFSKTCGLSHVTYHYPNTEKNVLDDATMEIPFGKSVGIVGASGAGKTTAVDIMLGLLDPQDGKILCDGVDIRENYSGWLRNLSYIPQSIYLMDTDIAANVAYGETGDQMDEAKIIHALEEAQLMDFINTLPDGIHTQIGERGIRLSGGQRQRIGIARALYNDPELLIFDEATSSLDNDTESAIMESIEALHGRKTLVIIAHRLTTIENCDMVYRVENGKIQRER